jgi:hypothetical protein
MSTTPLDMPILISQLPNLQQLAAAQSPSEAQQVMFGQLVAENQHKNEQKVQAVEHAEGLEAMGAESGGNKNQQPTLRQQHRPPPVGEETAPTQSSNASPWTGNIINVKI